MDNERKNRQMSPVVETLLLAAVFAVCILGAPYFPLLALTTPFIGIYAYAKHGLLWGVLFLATAVAVLYFFVPAQFVLYGVLLVIVALLCGFAIQKRLPAYESLMVCTAAWVLALGAAIGFVYYQTGSDPITAATAFIEAKINEGGVFTETLYLMMRSMSMVLGGAADASALQATMPEMISYLLQADVIGNINSAVSAYLPMLAMDLVVIGALLSYVIPRALVKAGGKAVAPIPSFAMFKLPKKVSWYFIGMFLLALIPDLVGLESLAMAALLLRSALTMVFMIQGMSLVYWLFLKATRRKGLSVLLLILAVLLFSGVFTWVGLIEQVFRVRERNGDKNDQKGGF